MLNGGKERHLNEFIELNCGNLKNPVSALQAYRYFDRWHCAGDVARKIIRNSSGIQKPPEEINQRRAV
jgi:hypothetical protein